MKSRAILFLILSSLLAACAPTASTISPTAAPSPTALVDPTRAPSRTLPPSPSTAVTQSSAPTPTTTSTYPPADGSILERVAQLGGSISGITIAGDVAYVGMGPRVAAFDIRRHENPQLMLQSQPLPGLVTQLLQISDSPAPLLLVNAGKYLVVVDISDPEKITPIHQLEFPGAITAMVWDAHASILYAGGSIYQGTHAYSSYTGFISAVEVSTDRRLKLLETVTLPEWPLSLALGKESLFASAQGYEGGVFRLQLNTPGQLSMPHLVIASTPEKPLQPLRMQVIGERLYLSYMEVAAYDITDPDQPKQIWVKGTGGNVVKDFQIAGEQIYIFGWTIHSEFMHNVVTPPEPIVGSTIGDAASTIAVHTGDFMVAYRDLEIYETANPQGLALLGSYQTPLVNPIGAVANEKTVFVVDHGIGEHPSQAVLHVLSLPDLNPLGQVAIEFPTSWGNVCFPWIALDDDRLYLTSANSIWVFDVTSLQPLLLGKVDITGGRQINTIAAFTQGEKRLLIISQAVEYLVNNLMVYDLTDLQAPARLSEPLTIDQNTFMQMTLEGSVLYVMMGYTPKCRCNMLYVVDIGDNVLAIRESLQLPQYTDYIAVNNDLVAVASTQELRIVSAAVSMPLKPLALSNLPEHGKGVAIIQDRAWVVVGDKNGAAQLLVYDLINPNKPIQVEVMDIANSNSYIVPLLTTQSYVVLVNGAGGVEVFTMR